MTKQKEETPIWEEFGMSEEEFDKEIKVYQHAEIDSDGTWSSLINLLFSDKKSKARAWSIIVSALEEGKHQQKITNKK